MIEYTDRITQSLQVNQWLNWLQTDNDDEESEEEDD